MSARFEHHVVAILDPAMPGKRAKIARDVAHVVMLATGASKVDLDGRRAAPDDRR